MIFQPKIGIQVPDCALFFCIISPVGGLFESTSGVGIPIGPISLWADPQPVRVPEGEVAWSLQTWLASVKTSKYISSLEFSGRKVSANSSCGLKIL